MNKSFYWAGLCLRRFNEIQNLMIVGYGCVCKWIGNRFLGLTHLYKLFIPIWCIIMIINNTWLHYYTEQDMQRFTHAPLWEKTIQLKVKFSDVVTQCCCNTSNSTLRQWCRILLSCSSESATMFEISDDSRRSDVEFDDVATHQSTVGCW